MCPKGCAEEIYFFQKKKKKIFRSRTCVPTFAGEPKWPGAKDFRPLIDPGSPPYLPHFNFIFPNMISLLEVNSEGLVSLDKFRAVFMKVL